MSKTITCPPPDPENPGKERTCRLAPLYLRQSAGVLLIKPLPWWRAGWGEALGRLIQEVFLEEVTSEPSPKG